MILVAIETRNSTYVLKSDNYGMSLMGDNLMDLVGMSEVCVTELIQMETGKSFKVRILDMDDEKDILHTSTVVSIKTILSA